MTHLFSALLDQSLTACWVIPAVLLLRFCLKKAPKRVTNLLWLVVAFRLVCPVSFESDLSLVTQAQNLSHAAAELRGEVEAYRPVDSQPTVTLPEDVVFDTPTMPMEPVSPALPIVPESPAVPEIVIPPEETPREQPFISRQLVLRAGCGIWLAGVAAMALFGLISTRQWHKRVKTAVRCEDGLWRSECVESPFILGVLRPKIYLPFVLPCGAESHVIAHERAHLKRHDPLLKCFAFVLLAVYWFHPLVWISYFLFCRDIELACDQQVTRDLDAEGKKAYSRALLACTVSRDPLLCPLSFGEVGVKARVKAVLRKNPSKVFVFTALVLCTILIICCAANPKEEHPWDEAYRQTLEELLKQYGANEDYGLQSVTTLDLWEDGVPELVVFQKVAENADSVMLYEYADGQATLRFQSWISHIQQSYPAGSGQLLWKQSENGPCFAGYTQNNDTSKYANRQCMKVITLSQQLNSQGEWTSNTDCYYEMYNGRWYRDEGDYFTGIKAIFPEDDELNVLFSDWVDLSDHDLDDFIRQHWGARSYYQAYLTVLDEEVGYSNNVLLVDMELDGIPELLTDDNGTVLLYQYDQADMQAKLLYSWPVAEGQYYWLDMTEPYPVLVVELHGDTQERFAVAASDGSQFRTGMLTAKGSHKSPRSWLSDHTATGDFFGKNAGLLSADEYESLRISLLENADRYNPHEEIFGTGTGFNGILHSLESASLDSVAPKEKTALPMEYADVLRALIAQYGVFHLDEKTDFVLGLKYAGLHKLKYDSTPSLVTLVNTRDTDGVFHMTLRVYRAEESGVRLLYETELGNRYGQTDVSYTFHAGREIITYHSPNEWTEEVIHIYDPSNGTRVLRAVTNGQNDFPTNEALEQFWLDGEAISWRYYTMETAPLLQDSTEIDACWDVAPASRADLEAFLNKMGVLTHSYPPAGYGETVAAAHHSMLSGLMTVHGTTPEGIVGATIVDLEQDGVPELLVQHGMNLELYRYEKNHSRLIWSGLIGVRFGQTDASYEYIITTHIDTFCIIIHDSKDAWMEEVWRVITLENGVIHEKELRAWAEADTSFLPERDNLIHFSIDGVEVPEKRYYYQLIDYIDGSMAVSAVHPYARPNSDEYMAQLLADLAAGILPEIGDSEHRAIAWWLMANNDGEPLDEETAMKFGAAKREFPAEPPIHCEEGSVFMWNEPHDFCRYIQKDGEDLLILACREGDTQIATGTVYHVDENGYLTVMERDVVLDTFRATLVGDFDGQTLVHRRYHTDCYSGMEGCEDCFRSDLILWNAERTETIKLRENVPLANHFEVIAREGNMVTITYQVGPAHSEYDKVVTGMIDLEKKTFSRLSVEPLLAQNEKPTAAYGELTYRGKTYGLPQYPQYEGLTSGEHAVEQVGKHLLITTHVNPDDIVCDVFNTETLAFEKHFWGLVLDWQGDDLTTLIYCQWNTLFTFDDLAIGEIGQSVMPKVFRVEKGWFSYDGSTFTISYSDDNGLVQQEVFPMPDREILVAANTLDGRTIWRTGLLFCPTYNGLTNTEALSLATELVDRYGPVSQWPFESCQVDHTPNGSTKLTLLQPHNKSKLCLDYTFYLQPDGTIIRAEDCIADGYSGTLVYEDDNCAIIASRRSEGCLRGGDPCGYCYVSDLTLWNADRTKGTLLLEGAELGIDFTVLDGPDKNGVLSISYHTGLSHSDSTTMVFGDIDLSVGVYTETAREYMPV